MIEMPEAILALGSSLIAAGMAIWFTLQKRALDRNDREANMRRKQEAAKMVHAMSDPAFGRSAMPFVVRVHRFDPARPVVRAD